MLSAENSALVAGASVAPATQAAGVRVRILRAVMVDGYCVDAGREITVDKYFAAQLVSANKAERLPPAPEPKPAAKAAKEKTHVER